MHASSIFVRDFPRFIQKLHSPVFGALQGHELRRAVTPCIDKVELDSSLAFATALTTILAMRPCLVAFQMTLSTGQAARPHAFWLAALAMVVAIAGVHRFSLDIRLGPYSLDFLA